MSDSTPCCCQVLAVRGLDFLLGDPDMALAIAVHIGTPRRAARTENGSNQHTESLDENSTRNVGGTSQRLDLDRSDNGEGQPSPL